MTTESKTNKMTANTATTNGPPVTQPITTTVRSGAHALSVTSSGSGPDVVFVHGWPLDSRTWRNVVANLDGYRCHLIDLPGAGRSTSPEGTQFELVEGGATAVLDTVDALGLERFTLVGQDSGGLTARYAAARRPDQVEALVLSGSEIPNHHGWRLHMFKTIGRLPIASTVLRLALSNRWLRASPFALGQAFADRSHLRSEFNELLVRPLVEDRALLARQVALLRSFTFDQIDHLAELHPKITAPTLLVWGARDPFFPPKKAEAMAAQFGGESEFVTLDDARLFVHEEQPEAFARQVSTFLSRHVLPSQ